MMGGPRDPDLKKQYRRNYYAANRERELTKNREWHEANREHRAAYSKARTQKMLPQRRARTRERYATDPDFRVRLLRRNREGKLRVGGVVVYLGQIPPEWQKVALMVRETRALLKGKEAHSNG
jgi:hypothetical protein